MNKKSVLDQFAPDAINAPETVTGGRKGRTRTRTRGDASAMNVGSREDRRHRTRTRRHHG